MSCNSRLQVNGIARCLLIFNSMLRWSVESHRDSEGVLFCRTFMCLFYFPHVAKLIIYVPFMLFILLF